MIILASTSFRYCTPCAQERHRDEKQLTGRKTWFENPKLPNFGCVDRFENLRCDFKLKKVTRQKKCYEIRFTSMNRLERPSFQISEFES